MTLLKVRDAFFSQLKPRPEYLASYGSGALAASLKAAAAFKAGRILPPGLVEVHLTDLCNMRCVACLGRDQRSDQRGTYFDETTTVSLVRDLGLYWKAFGCQGELRLSGMRGDPLTTPSLVRAVAGTAKEAEISKTGLMTNGVGLLSETWSFMKDFSYLVWSRNATSERTAASLAQVGVRSVQTTARRVMEYAEQRPKEQIMIMSFIISPASFDEAIAAIPFAARLKLNGIRFKMDQNLTGAPESFGRIFNGLRKQLLALETASLDQPFRVWAPALPYALSPRPGLASQDFFGSCLAQFNTGVVDSRGDVHGCYWGPRDNPALNFGSLTESSFRQIWEGEKRRRLAGSFPTDNCRTCPTAAWLVNNAAAVGPSVDSKSQS